MNSEASFLPLIESHFRALLAATNETQMWPAVLDTRTGDWPEEEHVPQRVYRLIGAPRGSTLYWDQPLVVAACRLSELTDKPEYEHAARAYIRSFLERCVDEDGMFQWGNHMYYDVFEKCVAEFQNGHHELRPFTPAWDLFRQEAPERTEHYIRTMAERHVYDPETGGFDRHDVGRKGHAFLEAGGILVESLAWLYEQTEEEELLGVARRIANYSFSHRGDRTGLVVNEPDHGRWDSKVSTTEAGLWAQCLLRAWVYCGEDELSEMAEDAVMAWVEHGYDEEAGRYWGQLDVETGKPVIPEQSGYWPGKYSDPWSTDQWPTHDYPMSLAQACVALSEMNGEHACEEAVDRWARIVMETRPARRGGWAYADSYGRCLHFLMDRGREDEAEVLACEAVERLWENGMCRGFEGGHVYEAVDGVGLLFLALLRIETGRGARLHGLGW